MRNFLGLAASLAVLVPGVALAEDPCSRTPSDVVAGFGTPAGTPEDGRTAYMPAGLKVLDLDVPYVLVMRSGADAPVDEIAYRLANSTRKVGGGYDASLSKAFDDAFQGGNCGKSKNSSCGVRYDPEKSQGLSGAELNSGSLWLEDKRTGPAIGLIRSDMNLDNAAPVFLVCVYEH